jgi:L-glyceraldehyde 3-phosphate reductase
MTVKRGDVAMKLECGLKEMSFKRCGRSGLKLPSLSLGLWHNFGGVDPYENAKAVAVRAFELGITHFDLANNYGPPPGSAEETFGRILREVFVGRRDELVVSSKAGYLMWEGPYGDWGSRKYILASLEQSLKRLGLDYVDIFYHHRPDPETPIEESMGALSHAVRQGKALYVGISNYKPAEAELAIKELKRLGTPCLIHQARYNMFDRWVEDGLLSLLEREGVGCIAFSPLAQGLLTGRYLSGIPEGSRASKANGFLKAEQITPAVLARIRTLDSIAKRRGQTLAQMAVSWILRRKELTSALVGASSPAQLEDTVKALKAAPFQEDELQLIEQALAMPAS